MSGCCGGGATAVPSRMACPDCGLPARSVERRTLLHWLRWPRNRALPELRYFHCANPECELAYFAEEGARFERQALRLADAERPLICYCFGISETQADEEARAFVLEQTRQGLCACEVRNPAGRCCLGTFPQEAKPRES